MGIEDMNNNYQEPPKKIPKEEKEMSIKEQAGLFRQQFKEEKENEPAKALESLNIAIEKGLIDPTHEGDHKQDELMHAFADRDDWDKVKEIITQTVKPDSQKGRILFYELNSGKKYDGPRVAEKKLEDYSQEEIEKHQITDYDSCMEAIRMEKFEEAELHIQALRENNKIDEADHLSRELMNKHIEKENLPEAKRVVTELTDKSGSIEGRKRHLKNLAGKPFEEI